MIGCLATVQSDCRGLGMVRLGLALMLMFGMLFVSVSLPLRAQAIDGCAQLPDHAGTRSTLQAILQSSENGGFGHAMWIALVDRDGVICVVAFAGSDRGDQWPSGRTAAAAKANTANTFSVPERALSSANLYSAMLPGGTFYGMQQSNPLDGAVAYLGPASRFGQLDDPMNGARIGGIVALGGGLPLYDTDGRLLGALGVSGDTPCADHIIAWQVRDRLALDHVPDGVSPSKDDNMVLDPDSPWAHPLCGLGEDLLLADLPKRYPIDEIAKDVQFVPPADPITPTVTLEALIPTPTPLFLPTVASTVAPIVATPTGEPISPPSATFEPEATVAAPVTTATATLTVTPSLDVAATPVAANRFVPDGFNAYQSTMLDISLLYPDDWRVAEEEQGSGLIVESAESCIDIVEQADADCGVVLALPLDPGMLALDSGATAQLMQRIVTQFVGDAEIVAGPTVRRINDQEAAVAEFIFRTGEAALPGRIALIVHEAASETRAILLIGAASFETRESYLPLVDAVINSIILGEPDTGSPNRVLPRPAPTLLLQPTPVPTATP